MPALIQRTFRNQGRLEHHYVGYARHRIYHRKVNLYICSVSRKKKWCRSPVFKMAADMHIGKKGLIDSDT